MNKKKKPAVIVIRDVVKTYQLKHEKPTFSEQLLRRERKEKFHALNNFSVQIYKGEKVGIIGKNGSGKTTFLKIITGITTPNSGGVKTKGKVVSLIDLEAGFHSDLTGEENIFLNGLVIGMTRKEIREKFQHIVEFADIGKFIDAPLYTYSQGMKLRLGFAVAVHADPDILVLDESIMAGDQNFQQKTTKKLKELFKAGKTVVIVTHWLEFLEQHVKRVIWLEHGQVKKDGKTKEVLREYMSQASA